MERAIAELTLAVEALAHDDYLGGRLRPLELATSSEVTQALAAIAGLETTEPELARLADRHRRLCLDAWRLLDDRLLRLGLSRSESLASAIDRVRAESPLRMIEFRHRARLVLVLVLAIGAGAGISQIDHRRCADQARNCTTTLVCSEHVLRCEEDAAACEEHTTRNDVEIVFVVFGVFCVAAYSLRPVKVVLTATSVVVNGRRIPLARIHSVSRTLFELAVSLVLHGGEVLTVTTMSLAASRALAADLDQRRQAESALRGRR